MFSYTPIKTPVPKKETAAEIQAKINRLRLHVKDQRILRIRRTLTKIDIAI